MHALTGITITANKFDILDTLRKNRAEHKEIVEEARKGYVERARKEVEKKLAKLKEGRIVQLFFNLEVPQDYTSVYDTAIKMLELDQNETVKLTSQQVRNLVMDEWDWKEQFVGSNAVYSSKAKVLAMKSTQWDDSDE